MSVGRLLLKTSRDASYRAAQSLVAYRVAKSRPTRKRVRGLAMDATKKGDIIEAFGIHGSNAPTVDKHIFGIVLRSVGMNPTNDEIADLFQKGSKGGMIDATTCVAMAIEFLAKSKDNDKEYVCRVCASSSCSASAAALYPDALHACCTDCGKLSPSSTRRRRARFRRRSCGR